MKASLYSVAYLLTLTTGLPSLSSPSTGACSSLNGICIADDKCPGHTQAKGYCSDDMACCITDVCTVPDQGSGFCLTPSDEADDCPNGTWHGGFCEDAMWFGLECCVPSRGLESGLDSALEPRSLDTSSRLGIPNGASKSLSAHNMAALVARQNPADPCSWEAFERMMFKTPMPDFLTAQTSKNPPCFDWKDDGCSWSDDDPGGFDFQPSCQRLNFGYRNAKKLKLFSEHEKEMIDDQFRDDLDALCRTYQEGSEGRKKCNKWAAKYLKGAQKFGDKIKRQMQVPLQVGPEQKRKGPGCGI